MERMYGNKGARLHGLAVGIIVGGVAVMLAGVGLQWLDAQIGLMATLGLHGTAFGLAARLGGAMVMGGIIMLAIRPVAQTASEGTLQAEANKVAPLHGLRAARAAAALKRARNKAQAA